MSLVCTPQTGKVLDYNSSVDDQLVHRSSTDTRPVRQQNCPKSRETVKKGKCVIRDSGDGELAPRLRRSTTWRRQQWPSVKPGRGKRDRDDGSSDGVERVTSRAQTRSIRPTAGDPTSERQRLVRQEEAATRLSHSRRR